MAKTATTEATFKRSEIVGLLNAMDYEADNWSKAKTLGKLKKLPELVDETTDVGKHSKLLKKVLEAVQADAEITIKDDSKEGADEKPPKETSDKKNASSDKANGKASSTKGSKKAAKKGGGGGGIGKARVTILGHSASSVLRWMGGKKWDLDRATRAVAKFAKSDSGAELARSTIVTGLSDGRSGKYGAPAKLTADEIKKLETIKKTT